MRTIIVSISDGSIAVENLPAGLEIEVRDYRAGSREVVDTVGTDERGVAYVEHRFGVGEAP